MTRLRNLVLGGAVAALMMTGAVSQSYAEEPGTFQNRLNGATIGLPLGALPPPGLYTGLETAYLGWPGTGKGNQANGLYVDAIAQAVPLLYVPGWNFLGATYAMSAVVAFYDAQVLAPGNQPFQAGALAVAATVYVVANPFWNPITLSWNLGNGWFVSTGFNFVAPIGTSGSNSTNPDYWTLELPLAISYLANNWVLSANMFFDFNTSSHGGCCLLLGTGLNYQSGDTFYLDGMAAYKFGKWELGPVAFVEAQFTNDSPGSGLTCASAAIKAIGGCGNYLDVGLGGIIGYDFGPVDLQLWITDSVAKQNAIDGLDFWTRIGFRLWGPEAPKPLVAKN